MDRLEPQGPGQGVCGWCGRDRPVRHHGRHREAHDHRDREAVVPHEDRVRHQGPQGQTVHRRHRQAGSERPGRGLPEEADQQGLREVEQRIPADQRAAGLRAQPEARQGVERRPGPGRHGRGHGVEQQGQRGHAHVRPAGRFRRDRQRPAAEEPRQEDELLRIGR